jgi:DNA-binding beta-propeller fold protein YncE
MRKFYLIRVFFLLNAAFIAAQTDDTPLRPGPVTGGTGAPALTAAEEFRFGINAFNRFAYNEAILSFERALSFRPGEPLILEWLGNSYYRSGFEDTALRQWRSALDIYGRNSGPGMLLHSRIETIKNRRSLLPVPDDEVRYVETGRYPGRNDDVILYRQPTSVLCENDGSVWIVAYGSNEIVKMDVNGRIKDIKRGPFNGFDRPYDLVRGIDGRLYLSEYRGGRVSVLSKNGDWLSYIGGKGLGNGMFVGPQHLTVDEDGYLYVVDYGNRRISKFDPDGLFILSFGYKNPVFQGFLSPTGIAAEKGKIYAADSAAKAIFIFDPNGNYLGRLALDNLQGPESLRFLSDGKLLVADTNRVILVDILSANARELGLAGSNKVRITGADIDCNGNIIAANFDSSEVKVLTRFDDLASGFFVQIRNIDARRFPSVTVELTVEDRLRRPIMGLNMNDNFFISEDGNIVSDLVFHTPGYLYSGADISLLVERSPATANNRDDFGYAARDIRAAMAEISNSRIVSVISAGIQPQREKHDTSLENAVRGSSGINSARWRFDLGLRLAASDLLPMSAKRAVIYIGSGDLGEFAFEQYSLSELSSYLANNGIVFNAIITGSGSASAALEYLCNETGGKAVQLYHPRGIGQLIRNIALVPSSLYSFTFQSKLPTDFGRAWLPLEAEVYLMERSGRDTTGYFAPLE